MFEFQPRLRNNARVVVRAGFEYSRANSLAHFDLCAPSNHPPENAIRRALEDTGRIVRIQLVPSQLARDCAKPTLARVASHRRPRIATSPSPPPPTPPIASPMRKTTASVPIPRHHRGSVFGVFHAVAVPSPSFDVRRNQNSPGIWVRRAGPATRVDGWSTWNTTPRAARGSPRSASPPRVRRGTVAHPRRGTRALPSGRRN